MPRPAALAALLIATLLPACKDGKSDTTQVAALARELQAFGQQGDVPASAAHRDWLLEHIGWDELVGVFMTDALNQLEPERRAEALRGFLHDIREPSTTTKQRRKHSLTRLTVALGNNPCKVIKADPEDQAWAHKSVASPAPTDGLSAADIQSVNEVRAKLAKIDRFYTIDCGRKMVHIVVAALPGGRVLPLIRDMKGGGPANVPHDPVEPPPRDPTPAGADGGPPVSP